VGMELDLDELRALSVATKAEIDTYFEQIKREVGDRSPGPDPEELEQVDEEEDDGEDMLN
jgi:hypothetical protein